ncbi:MAG: hypothetical protein RLZZ488_2491 [Pseudomonadota bacterium]
MLSGLATFVGLKVLQHTSESDEVFSRLSLLILSFTTFQLISDFGTHTQFLRSYQLADDQRRPALCLMLLQSRLALGLLIVALAVAYCLFAGFTQNMLAAFLCYQLAFIPFALISTADSIFFARHEFNKAIAVRVARLMAMFVFLAAAAAAPSHGEIWVAISSTLTFTVIGALSWFLILRQHISQSSENFKITSNVFKNLGSDGRSFLNGSAVAALVMSVTTVHGIVSHSLLVRSVGENRLTELNTSIALATPAVLAFQTLVQMVGTNLTLWSTLETTERLKNYRRYASRTLLILALMSAGLWVAGSLGIVGWFFPRSTAAVIPMSQMLILAHWALNLAAPTVVLCQYLNRQKSVFTALAVSAFAALAVQLWWVRQLQEQAYLLNLFILGLLTVCATFIISIRARPASRASS